MCVNVCKYIFGQLISYVVTQAGVYKVAFLPPPLGGIESSCLGEGKGKGIGKKGREERRREGEGEGKREESEGEGKKKGRGKEG